MDRYIQQNITKYQKTWPEPVCAHDRKSNTGNRKPQKYNTRQHPIVTERHRGLPNVSRTLPKTTLPGSLPRFYYDSVEHYCLGLDDLYDTQSRETTANGVRSRPRGSETCRTLPNSSRLNTGKSRNTSQGKQSAPRQPTSILRSYETKNDYGTLYQLRKLNIDRHNDADDKGDNWFWDKEYRRWREHHKQRLLGDIDPNEDQAEKTAKAKPHPDLYGAFNSIDLQKQLEYQSATTIQSLARGWLVRTQMARLRETAMELNLPAESGIKDYLHVRSKVKGRLQLLHETPELDLHDVTAFLQQKKEYEEVFQKLSTLSAGERTLPVRDLREFFTACGLNPSDREINNAFRGVFGAATELEVVLLLDRSEETGPLALKTHLAVAKDIARSLSTLPAVSRVDLVPFDEDIANDISWQANGDMNEFSQKIDQTRFRGGKRNSHLALIRLRQCFHSSSPGASKIGIVITGGMSSEPEKTAIEASNVRQENISLFTVGIGHGAGEQDITPPGNSYLVSGLGAWKRSCEATLEEIIAKSRFSQESHTPLYTEELCRPLCEEEVLAILWTIYPPRGVAARPHRRSTWLHPIIDSMEASPALEEEMSKQTDLLPCISIMIQSRLARDGFVVLPTDGPSGSERVHDLDTALSTFQHYLQTGKLDHLLN